MRFGVTLPPGIADEVTLGASIAINPAAVSQSPVIWLEQAEGLAVTFDAIDETQALTNSEALLGKGR